MYNIIQELFVTNLKWQKKKKFTVTNMFSETSYDYFLRLSGLPEVKFMQKKKENALFLAKSGHMPNF